MNILLVEDDPFIRDLVTIKLTEKQLGTVVADSAEKALALLKEQQIDLVLLDLDLPDRPGIEILSEIKNDTKLKSIPVIIFSNNDDPDVRTRAEEIGIADFFVKASTNFDELHSRIEEILKK